MIWCSSSYTFIAATWVESSLDPKGYFYSVHVQSPCYRFIALLIYTCGAPLLLCKLTFCHNKPGIAEIALTFLGAREASWVSGSKL
jgi:hypothetical protein